jgi:transposase InsO family protein
LHRCLRRHGISRLPEVAGDKPAKQPFKRYPIGYFHIDIAVVRTEEGKLYLFVAVDRTTTYAFARLMKKATGAAARTFLDELAAAVPYQIHTVLTDNGIQFADQPKNRDGYTARWRGHPFDRACQGHGIEHRLTKPNHPWTNGCHSACNIGSDAILVQLRLFRPDEPCLKQIDFSAAIHLTFDELEACDLAFSLSV